MSLPDSDLFPSETYRDPLLMPLYLRTNEQSSIWAQCMGDWLLNAYLVKLNQEIVDEIPEFADQKELLVEIFNATRAFGWSVVQPYPDEVYKVFTPLQKEDWIKELEDPTDPKSKLIRVGILVQWTDDLNNTYHEKLYFDDRINEEGVTEGHAYLFVWEKGNDIVQLNAPADSAFARADINISILSLAIQCRQIQSALTFSATNPYFYHFHYGESINDPQRAALVAQMRLLGPSFGLGAKESVVKQIEAIENGATEKCILALDQMISLFASNSRLPLSFYLGEKQTGGLGTTGEQVDEVKVDKKKAFILQHFTEMLELFFTEQFSTSLAQVGTFYEKKQEEREAKAEEDKKIQAKGKTSPGWNSTA